MSDTAPDATPEAQPFQFTLKMLLAFTAFVAVVCTLYVKIGDNVFWLIPCAFFVWVAYSYRGLIAVVVMLGILLVITMSLLFPGVRSPYPAGANSSCKNNLSQLGMALRNHEAIHQKFPSNVQFGNDGKTQYSWRIAILPEIACEDLFKAYRFDEGWNGPHNRKLAASDFDIWHCPGDHDAALQTTNYVAVVGPHTAWSPDRAETKDDFPDGLANTIFLVEIPNSGIHWMEPRDITVDQFRTWFAKLKDEPRLAPHSGGVNVLMGDGNVLTLPLDLSLETLDALLTRDGGEAVDLENLR